MEQEQRFGIFDNGTKEFVARIELKRYSRNNKEINYCSFLTDEEKFLLFNTREEANCVKEWIIADNQTEYVNLRNDLVVIPVSI